MLALVDYKGKQFKVEEGSKLRIPLVKEKVGHKLLFEQVIFLDNDKKKQFGSPYIKGFSIAAKILSHGRDNKVIVFKMKRRKGYQLKNGHRQDFTLVEVGKFNSPKKSVKPKAKTTSKKTVKKTEPTKASKTNSKKTNKE